MSSTQTVQSRWETMKPMAIALAIGLIAGPLITNYVGWQVTSRTARAETRDSVVEQLAHGKFWQSHKFSLLYRLARRGDYLLGGTGRRRQNTCR